jgi:UDP-3-O-[3-hydroxymyristoyl] glucosamine N-acyltransferase
VNEDTLIVAQTGIAGSSTIGKRVVMSGQTGIIDHRTVADDAILVHRCGVTEDIPTAGMWAGTPPKPFKEYVRELKLSKKVANLEAKIDELLAERDDKSK